MIRSSSVSGDLCIDHIEFYVADARASAIDLVHRFGFEVEAASDTAGDHYSVALRLGRIVIVLTEATKDGHPAAAYVAAHGDAVANIAMGTADARGAMRTAVARGARVVAEPRTWTDGSVTGAIGGFGDVIHTFVQRSSGGGRAQLAGLAPVDPRLVVPARSAAEPPDFVEVDHLAVCLESGTLDQAVEFYRTTLDFNLIFEERIAVGAQAMLSRVVQSESAAVTLTLIEPDRSSDPGQIDHFLKEHGGPGVQHIALGTGNIVATVAALRERGVEFLTAPGAYYNKLADRLDVTHYPLAELRDLDILVDADHYGQLFQIFARSRHPRRTFFFEVIERFGARTFGSGNIKALYEAVEAEQLKA